MLSKIDYTAPKPEYLWSDLLVSLVLFPLKATQWVLNPILGRLGSWIILQNQNMDAATIARYKAATLKNKTIDNKERFLINTHDGASLDTFQIRTKNSNKYIIYFSGIGGVLDQFSYQMSEDAEVLKCNTIAFSYRGVGFSTGKATSFEDLVTDGIAQVQRLLDKNILPENIMLNGQSMGGSVATLVAKYFHDRGQRVYLYNDRSFSSFTNVAVGQIRTFCCCGPDEYFLLKCIGWIFKPIIYGFLWLSKWEVDAAGAYQSIPDAYKKYTVIRSPRELRNSRNNCKDDSWIPHYASLHKGITIDKFYRDALIGASIGSLAAVIAITAIFFNGGIALIPIIPILVISNIVGFAGVAAFTGSITRAIRRQPRPEILKVEKATADSFKNTYEKLGRNPSKMVTTYTYMDKKNPARLVPYCGHGNSGEDLVNAYGATGKQYFHSFFNKMRIRPDHTVSENCFGTSILPRFINS
jgi:pimeloyl-ACP methyl ester carboxylesterase